MPQLTEEECKEAWGFLLGTSLAKVWPELEKNYLPWVEKISLAAGDWIFHEGDPPQDFYIVGNGVVRLTLRRNGAPWLQRDMGQGAAFGQTALYLRERQIEAQAIQPAIVYRMKPVDLRNAIERNEKLYEYLLHEKLLIRLRPIPLFRTLADDQLRWLGVLVEESEVAGGAEVSISEKPGLWIVEWGQIEVAGPATGGPIRHCLTAGSFFLSGGSQWRHGEGGIPQSAKAVCKTRLFFLPADVFDALVQAIPDFEALTERPLDLPAILAGVPLLSGLSEEHRQHLAGFCAWRFVPAGQNITSQGQPGRSLVILREGSALITALDDRGRPRPRNYRNAPDSYGETSLLRGKQHDVTMRAVPSSRGPGLPPLNGTDIVTLDRRDLQIAFRERRKLWTPDVSLVKGFEEVKQAVRQYAWMQDGEVLQWRGRSHWLWLALPELGVLGAFLLLLFVTLITSGVLASSLTLITAVVTGLVLIPLAFLIIYNYLDDYYAITNRRVTRRDHQLLIYEARTECPIETIQDISSDAGFWGRLFNYGEVAIRSAARVGAVVFEQVPQPDQVRELILQQKVEAAAGLRGQQREKLRREVMTGLRLTLPIPEETPALGETAIAQGGGTHHSDLIPMSKRPPPDWIIRLVKKLPERWSKVILGKGPKRTQLGESEFLWRKHWVQLLNQAGPPFVILLLWISIGLLLFNLRTNILGLTGAALGLPWALILLFLLAWVWWEYEDYHNDLYIVTDDKIIDIEATPLWLSMKRREGGLDRVQNVIYVQRGIWQNLLNYGNVEIKTAATGEGYTFFKVGNPRLVQAVVFQKLDAFRSRLAERQTRDRQREIIEGLDVYNELKGENQ